MNDFTKALLRSAAALLLLSPLTMAQDALSVVLSSPYSSRVGSQLVYAYEDGITTAARGEYISYITVTNTSSTTYVSILVQAYTAAGEDVIDFVDVLSPSDKHVYSPRAFKRNMDGQASGSTTNGRFMLTITAISSRSPIADRRAIAFNYLSGQLWTSNVTQGSTSMVNAVARMAVNFRGKPQPPQIIADFAYGGPINATHAIPGTPVNVIDGLTSSVAAEFYGTGVTGNGLFLQVFRPNYLILNSFFPPRDLFQTVPSGDRLTLVSFRDDYTPADNNYRIKPYMNTLSSKLFNDMGIEYPIPPQRVTFLSDYGVGFDAAGNFTNFIGWEASLQVFNSGGWIIIRPSLEQPLNENNNSVQEHPGSLFGWFEQSLGTFGGSDILASYGRRSTIPFLGRNTKDIDGNFIVCFPILVDFDPVTGVAILDKDPTIHP